MAICRPEVPTTSLSAEALMLYTLPGSVATAMQFWYDGMRGSQMRSVWSQLPLSSSPARTP